MEHTVKRGAVYHYRRRIPPDLVEHYGKREITFSLRTKNRPDAQREARRASVRLDSEWDALRRERPKGHPALSTSYDLVEVAGRIYSVPPPPGGWPKPEDIDMTDAEWLRAQELYEREFEEEQRLHPEHHDADAPIGWQKVDPHLRAILERHGIGPTTSAQSIALAAHPHAGRITRPAKTTTLDTLVVHWRRERSVNTKTIAKMERAVLEFNLFHKDPVVQSITRAMVIAYRSDLLKRTKANGERALSKGTIDDRLSSIGTLLQLAFDHDIVPQNVATKTALPQDKLATKARIGYTAQQADVVMGGTEEYRETHPARYWLPRLARWTGARLNELHQLRRQDLVERDGIKGINIIDEGEHAEGVAMRMKNAASRRWVPLHTALADFWTWAQGRPTGALFPAKPDKHGIVSSEFSKWYGRALRSKWGITDDRVTFHSWRHAFADACRAAGLQDSARLALMGHAEAGAAGGYGSGSLPPQVLAKAVSQL